MIDGHAERKPSTHRVAEPGGSRDAKLGYRLGKVMQSMFEVVPRRVLRGRRSSPWPMMIDGDDPVNSRQDAELTGDQDAALPVKPCKSTSGVPLP